MALLSSRYVTGTVIVSATVLSLEERKRGVREVDVRDGRRPHRIRTRTRRRGRCNRLDREAELAVPRRQLVARASCTREAEALTRGDVPARVGAGHVRNAARGDVDAEGRAAKAGDLTGALEERSLVGTRQSRAALAHEAPKLIPLPWYSAVPARLLRCTGSGC
jgi:hypothetical protein